MSCWINRSISSWSGRPKSNRCWGKLYVLHCGEKSLPGSLGMGARRDWKQSLSISHVFFTAPDSCFFHGADRQTDLGGRSFGRSGCRYVSAGQDLGSACPPGQAFCKLSILPFLFWWAWHTGLSLNFEIFFSQPGLNFLVVLRNCILCTLYLRLKNKKGWGCFFFFLWKIICWALSRFQIQFLVKDSRYNYCDRDQSLSELWKCWGPTL